VRPPEAVLFDLDETLTDRPASLRRFAAVFGAAYRERLAPIEAAELERLVVAADRAGGGREAPPGPDRHDRVVAEALTVGASRLGTLPWRDAPTADELAAYWTAVFPGCAAPADGLHETLAALRGRGVRVGIVTNGVVARQAPKVAVLGLDGLVDAVVVSEAVGVSKPDRRIFDHALAALGVRPEAAWFVGDNPVTDVLGARRAGLTPVWLRRGPWPADHPEPELRIETLGELLPLIARPAVRPDEAVGFLYDPASGRVLLNLRSPDKGVHAGKWAFFGGRAEPGDADLVATWCREMREELGAAVDRFAAALGPGARVLDLGCGPGIHTAWLRERGLRAVGGDRLLGGGEGASDGRFARPDNGDAEDDDKWEELRRGGCFVATMASRLYGQRRGRSTARAPTSNERIPVLRRPCVSRGRRGW
jgi:putative hydrolase of the HAD superfamily